MNGFWQDVRYGLRRLRQSPGFTLLAVLTLALGIGANTAIFGAVHSVLLRPLPYKDASRLVNLWTRWSSSAHSATGLSYPELSAIQAQSRSFEQIAAYQQLSMNLTGGGSAETVTVLNIAPEFFSVMGARVALGRPFRPGDAVPGQDRSVILSQALWRSRFGADARIVGRSITLNGEPYAVVGVMAPGFAFPPYGDAAELWRPLAVTAQQRQDRGSSLYSAVAKLRAGVSAIQAQADLEMIAAREAQAYPASEKGVTFSAVPLHAMAALGATQPLMLLLAAVGFVLLIACANVAGLLLARASGRGREITIRAALGATRTRLIRQMITESLLLSAAGCFGALLLGTWGLDLLRGLAIPGADRVSPAGLSVPVLWFTMGVSLLTGLVFGLAPALEGSRPDLNAAFKGETALSAGRFGTRRGQALRRSFVAAQVALTVVLLVGAGLLLKSLWQLMRVHTGYRLDHVLSVQINVPLGAGHSVGAASASLEAMLARIRGLPGVEGAALAASALGEPRLRTVFETENHQAPAGAGPNSWPGAQWFCVTPGYFQAAGITLVQGRAFREGDDQASTPPVIVNELLARRYWPSGDALGKRIRVGGASPAWAETVGIAANTRDVSRSAPVQPQIYEPFRSFLSFLKLFPAGAFPTHLIVHTSLPSDSLEGAIRAQIWAVAPSQPVARMITIEQAVAQSEAEPKTRATLLGFFAGLGLLLAAVGIYGLISYTVSQRTHEIGLRMALGAQPSEVLRMVMREGMASAGAGLALGIGGALGLSRFLQSQLWGIQATDIATYFAVAILLAAVAGFACYVPARRAMRIDPAQALRQE